MLVRRVIKVLSMVELVVFGAFGDGPVNCGILPGTLGEYGESGVGELEAVGFPLLGPPDDPSEVVE